MTTIWPYFVQIADTVFPTSRYIRAQKNAIFEPAEALGYCPSIAFIPVSTFSVAPPHDTPLQVFHRQFAKYVLFLPGAIGIR